MRPQLASTISAVIVGCAILLAGQNAAALSKKQCEIAIWDAIGFEDTLDGDSEKKFTDHKKDCSKAGIAVDEAAYERGRSIALEIYCSPTYGLAIGTNGGSYDGVCAGDRESAFLAAYRIGAGYYPAAKEAWDARGLYEAVNQVRNNAVSALNSAQMTLSKADATAEERANALEKGKKAQKDIRDANFQIGLAQGRLNAAEREFEAAGRQLDKAVEDADLFQEGNPAQRHFYALKLEDETVGAALVKDVKDGGAT